jgi:hypothetical protein
VRLRLRLFSGLLALSPLGCFSLSGCGGNSMASDCRITAINVTPATASADHAAPAPANTQHFDAFIAAVTPSSCVFITGNLSTVTWTVSDSMNVSISNVQGPTYGTATCKGATVGAVTVTATRTESDGTKVSDTASLTCN